MLNFPKIWSDFISSKIDWNDLALKVEEEYTKGLCFPPKELIFQAFDQLSPTQVKVVIIGQDPYHGKGQANGLAFSVKKGVPIPPSLRNIFKEIQRSYQSPSPNHGDLNAWKNQGVLLLNSILTVREGVPESHKNLGWEDFTNEIISKLSESQKGIVFMLWGSKAIAKETLINESNHLVLTSVHPSPLSAHRGFIGNNHFILANEYLLSKNKTPVNWALSEQCNIPFD